MRALASLGLVGIQQAVPGPFVLSLAVAAAAGLLGGWAVVTLRQR